MTGRQPASHIAPRGGQGNSPRATLAPWLPVSFARCYQYAGDEAGAAAYRAGYRFQPCGQSIEELQARFPWAAVELQAQSGVPADRHGDGRDTDELVDELEELFGVRTRP
jgi:hypothetical protein